MCSFSSHLRLFSVFFFIIHLNSKATDFFVLWIYWWMCIKFLLFSGKGLEFVGLFVLIYSGNGVIFDV